LFFPVPIRLASVILAFMYLVSILARNTGNAGGDAAHIAGMAAGATYVLTQSWRTRMKLRLESRMLNKQVQQDRDLKAECDRILKKVHDHGLQSLSGREKRILRKVTRMEQMRSPK
jgi:hypothetical protein